jgi:uncharacterized Fe-S cluster protein YjdI/CDGSH-type Zn-finger protein
VIEPGNVAPTPRTVDGVDYIEGRDLTLIYEGKKCIHSRFCVTWDRKVFIANVKGPWINPDAMSTEALTEIAHVCVSGAIRYKRKDGKPDEAPPPVNLVSVREGGPYAIRADIRLDGAPAVSHRLTLCRCGASKNKPFCDGSHHEVNFAASGEPPTGKADMLPVRTGRSPSIRSPMARCRCAATWRSSAAPVAWSHAWSRRGCVVAERATTSRSATAAMRAWASSRSGAGRGFACSDARALQVLGMRASKHANPLPAPLSSEVPDGADLGGVLPVFVDARVRAVES